MQQAIQQLSNLQNTYGDNLYAPVAPNAIQETLDTGVLESELDPLFDGDVIIEEGALEVNNHQETRKMEISKLPSLMIQTTTFCHRNK